MGDVRHVSGGERLFATGDHERRVRLWSGPDRACVAELDTVLDFGGERLALCGSEDEPVVVAGAWSSSGVAGYAADGAALWQRRDLKQVQTLSPAAGGALVAACFSDRSMHVLDVATG